MRKATRPELRERLEHRGHLHATAVRCSPKSDARRCGMSQQKTSKIALRLEPELRDRLEAAAELDRRPMANLIRNVLADWCDGRAQSGQVERSDKRA